MVLEKLRGWGIVLSILVALPLLLFIIDPSQIIQTVQSVSSKYDVGKIAGKSISYTDFQEAVERYSRVSELITGNSSSSEQQQKQVRDAVWQNFLDKNLFIKNAQAAGISVGKAEILDLTNGENVSPVIASLFSDANGNFSSESLMGFLQNVEDGDANAKLIWDYIKDAVVTSQYYNKYNALFTNTNIQNALQVNRAIAENNTTANVEFVMSPFTFMTDSTVVVSDQEIKAFYDNHKEFFKQKATVRKNNIKRMKEALCAAMIATGHDDKAGLSAGDFTLKVQNNGGVQPLKITGDVPPSMMKVIYEPDNERIREYLKENNADWAHLEERGRHLAIK